ncbi:hypothetical protein HNR05_002844 [Leifsonia psychrotolerans]|uniref:Uncharacterized protein n=1 Tax=Glaciibacter psychrotolerans TaxID=670054 RepID=A0A7Z0J7K2_9MICO|nr:hypothetical protein [Leifsonia psychrotolerans]
MYVENLSDLRRKVLRHFGSRAIYYSTSRYDAPGVSESGEVRFLLYDSFVFGFGIMEPPYTSLSIFLDFGGDIAATRVLGKELTFIENEETDLRDAFEVVNQYCRLRLPDRFLEAYDAL